MVPTNRPVSRAFGLYVSLLCSYISYYKLKESTSYFPNNYTKLSNLLEIQPNFLTVGHNANQGRIDPKFGHRHIDSQIERSRLLSLDTTVIRGI